MQKVKIKIKNYRCFGDNFQEFEIDDGFVSFIGVNNAGKSAILKMFFEFRNIWEVLSHENNLKILTSRHNHVANINGINDVDEIFNHYTNNAIELRFSLFQESDYQCIDFTLTITKHGNSVSVSAKDCRLNGGDVHFVNMNGNSNDVALGYIVERNGNEEQQNLKVDFIAKFFRKLFESVYIPSFRNTINVGENRNHYDVATGTAFIKQWNEWKVGNQKSSRDQITKITEDIRDLFGYKSLEINASQDQSTLRLTIDGRSYSLLEVGSGISQFILTFATVAVRKPPYIFIDEPELNLHPALQIKFLSSLGTYATSGVVFASHSIGLARSISERVYSVTNNGKETQLRKIEDTPNYSVLLGELSFSSYKEIGADSLLFVEGVTEVRVFQELLRKYKKDSKVLVMSLGGSEMINGKREMELAEITTRINVKKIFAWIDSEKEEPEKSLGRDRKDFAQICKKLKIDCHISERRALENYFSLEALCKTFPNKDIKPLDKFSKLDTRTNWSKRDNWKIARETTKADLSKTDLGKFLNELK